jgi:uncharacterized protein (TIGR02246 family)
MEQSDVARRAVQGVVARISRAWQDKDFAALPECFAEDAVMMGPGYKVLGRGRSFFVESYRDFATSAAILHYSESVPIVEVFDGVAICAYSWTMTYQREGTSNTETGSDQFVLVHSNSKWRVVWRYIFFQPSP